jgi:hypothetical protein
VTVSVTVVVWVRLPEVPVMVTVAWPNAAVLEAVRVRVLLVVALVGLKAAVTPVGRPLAERATDPAKLLMGVTVTVLVPAAPWTTLTLVGEAERE